MKLISIFLLMISGCALVENRHPLTRNNVHVAIANPESGQNAVYIGSMRPEQHLEEKRGGIRSLTIQPGEYVAQVECFRSGASMVVGDGSSEFRFSVAAGRSYGWIASQRPRIQTASTFPSCRTGHSGVCAVRTAEFRR